MTTERANRIAFEIKDTKNLYIKACKKLNDTKQSIEMDKAEGYKASEAWNEYLAQDTARAEQLFNHLTKLERMLTE